MAVDSRIVELRYDLEGKHTMALQVRLSKEGHFDGLEDEEGNTVAFLVVGSDEDRLIEQPRDPEEEDDDTDLWYPDEEVPVEMFATEVACDFCGEEDAKLRLCADCKNMAYCGDECQDKDWEQLHQHECQQEIDEAIVLQLSEAMQMTESEAIAAHPSDEEYEAFLIEQRGSRGGGGRSAPGRVGPRGSGSRGMPRRASSAPARRGRSRAPGRSAPSRRFRRDPFSPLTPARRTRTFARPPPGRGRGFGRWRRSFGQRHWFRPGLYPWFTLWYPGYAFLYATAVTYPFLYWPRSRFVDPNWYFDPLGDPREVDRKLWILRRRYAVMISRGFDIVPDYNRGSFRWIRRRF